MKRSEALIVISNVILVIYLFCISACSSESEFGVSTIRDFDIYANDTVNNVLIFDMVPTPQGLLLTGICNTSRLNNKFDGDGRIYLLQVDLNGNVIGEPTCSDQLFLSGYPSNLVDTDISSKFQLFWNEFNGNLKSIEVGPQLVLDSADVQQLDCNGCRADNVILAQNKYYTIGLSESFNAAVMLVNEFSFDLLTYRQVTEQFFDVSEFGGFGLTDLNFVNRISNFVHIRDNQLRLIYSGPSNDEMILSHVGEILPEYSNKNLWIADLAEVPGEDERFSIIVMDPNEIRGQTSFIPEIDLSGLPGQSTLEDLVSQKKFLFPSLDPDFPQYILNYSESKWVIVGTSISGLPTVISFNNNEIHRTELGENNRLEMAKAIIIDGTLYIAGTTLLNNRFQRPFLMKLSEKDIF